MKALRPDLEEVGTGSPAANLAELREKIVDQDYELQELVATLSDGKQKLLDLQGQSKGLKQNTEKLRDIAGQREEQVRKSDSRLISLRGKQAVAVEAETRAKDILDEAKRVAQVHQDDPEADAETKAKWKIDDRRAIQRAQRGYDDAVAERRRADEAVAQEELRNKNLVTDWEKAKADVTAAEEAEKANAEAREKLEGDIRAAAVKVATSRRTSTGLVNKDNALFAELRDNAPYLYAAGKDSATDPLEKVTFVVFKDKARVMMYGLESDIRQVEDILAAFDRPQPHARLTLRVLEVNVINDQAGIGAQRYNDAFQEVQKILADVREQSSAAETILRDSINMRVRYWESAAKLNVANGLTVSPQEASALNRFSFYQPEVLRGLGAPGVFASKEEIAFALRNIPDPARTSTLGEALLVLTLASHTEQRLVIDGFKSRLARYFKSRKFDMPEQAFAGALRAMGIDEYAYGAAEGMSHQQRELVMAIQRRTVENMVDEMREDGAQIADPKVQNETKSRLRAKLDVRYRYLAENFSLSPAAVKDVFETSDPKPFLEFVGQFPVSEVNARIAASDKMLKSMIERIEDDVNTLIVNPAMAKVRNVLRKKNMEVGILTTTDVLATNRFPARVDAAASAEVALGEKQDILAAAQQLASLAVSSSNKDVAKILKDLQSNPNQPSRELYGIGTGGLFQVTPFFDPSGQAMRFNFDYVAASRVREPNGSTNPLLPRIERHSINTEVELSTFELRNISEFTSNAKLGLAPHKWGGIPILNDIPILKELPIIGWFVRKEGRAAVSQHSLVFAQTTIYPTIDDMLNLLTPMSSRAKLGGQ